MHCLTVVKDFEGVTCKTLPYRAIFNTYRFSYTMYVPSYVLCFITLRTKPERLSHIAKYRLYQYSNSPELFNFFICRFLALVNSVFCVPLKEDPQCRDNSLSHSDVFLVCSHRIGNYSEYSVSI